MQKMQMLQNGMEKKVFDSKTINQNTADDAKKANQTNRSNGLFE